MENLIELPTAAQPSLLLLNHYCLLELFDFLKLKDSVNLAETCIYLSNVADRTFRKYSRIYLVDRMFEKEEEWIHRFFARFGHHVLSLVISSPWRPLHWRILKNCENLKKLEMCRIYDNFKNVPLLFAINNLEVMIFMECGEECIKSFLNIVGKVKALSICWCQVECNPLLNVLRNIPDVESFEWCWNGTYRFDFHFLEIISNVEKLCLRVELNSVSELDPLLKLNRLLKLQLWCRGHNITSFLSELAKKGIIQELELIDVAFDENFFEMLKSFDSLQLLVLDDDYAFRNELKASIVWPPNLQRFQFISFKFTLDAFLSTIKQLKYLECISFDNCRIAEGEEDNFNDVKKLSQQILFTIDNCDRKQRLDVVLPSELKFQKNESKEFLFYSERLRIYNDESNHYNIIEFSVNFPWIFTSH